MASNQSVAGWPTRHLVDCTSDGNISYGIVQPGQHTEGGIPIIRVNNFKNGVLDDSDVLRVSESIEENYRRTRLQGGEVLLTLVGSVGQTAIVSDDLAGWNVARAIAVIRPSKEVSAKWLSICLQSAEARHFLDGRANTTVQKTLNLGDVKRVPIPIPPKEIRCRIESMITSIDEKIDLNRRISQTLEAMAQAIFKSWFVDFDPVKAKIAAIQEGRDPLRAAMTAISGKCDTELDTLPPEQHEKLAATAALFPDEMEDSELGRVPSGWAASRIGEITSRVAMGPFGSDIKKDNFVESGVPVIRGGNLTDGLIERNYVFISESKADELKNANAFPGDIVITHRGTLGQVGLIPQRSKFPRYVVSQSQMLISADCERMSSRYLFEFLRSDIGKQLLLSNTSQVGVPAIARPTSSVKTLPLIIPKKTVLDAYEKTLQPLLLELTQLRMASELLAELRDVLLPKLLSGELAVSGLSENPEIA
ncbi:MAG: restriction endonuclease subunit S [Nitrospira sp.]|nr:restriction endonuclease subunit S [Nitrospira sp.]